MNVTQLYIETAFCVIEENQHVICSSGLPFKILACRILDSLCSDWDSELSCVTDKGHHHKVANIFLQFVKED